MEYSIYIIYAYDKLYNGTENNYFLAAIIENGDAFADEAGYYYSKNLIKDTQEIADTLEKNTYSLMKEEGAMENDIVRYSEIHVQLIEEDIAYEIYKVDPSEVPAGMEIEVAESINAYLFQHGLEETLKEVKTQKIR